MSSAASAGSVGPIVVGFEESEASRAALTWAADEARATGTDLVVVHVPHERHRLFGRNRAPETAGGADDGLIRAVEDVVGPGIVKEVVVRSGDAATALDAEAEARSASALVVGARSHGIGGRIGGSVAESLAEQPRRPLMVIKPMPPQTTTGAGTEFVVVGIDGSPTTETALRWAVDKAARHGWTVTAVMAWDVPTQSTVSAEITKDFASTEFEEGARQRFEHQVEGLGSRRPVVAQHFFIPGRGTDVLVDMSTDARLLVVGSRGLSGSSRIRLGSTSRAMLHHATVPLAIIPEVHDGDTPT